MPKRSHPASSLARKIFRPLLGKCGLDVFPRVEAHHCVNDRRGRDYHVIPDYVGCSSHKHFDLRALPEFGDLAKEVIEQGRTYLYYDRLYTLYQALSNIRRLVAASGDSEVSMAEVGVFRGGSSYFIASAAREMNLPQATLHSFDTFEGHAAQDLKGGVDNYHVSQDAKKKKFLSTQFESVQEYLAEHRNISLYKGRFQDNCAQITARTFHFVHLDVDIYEPTVFALDFFDDRLVAGGIIVVDDYGSVTCEGIRQAVDEFVGARPDYFSFHLLTGQHLLVKRSSTVTPAALLR
jgi:predicted O-methyltransferase YrrM